MDPCGAPSGKAAEKSGRTGSAWRSTTCCVEVHEIHLNIDEAQAEQAQNDAAVHGFQPRNEWREKINQMRHPVHRIEAQKPRSIPDAPPDRAGLGTSHG